MDNPMRVLIALALAAILAAALAGGCEPENDNAVECVESDCAAACAAKGFASGACVEDDLCRCGGTDVVAYEWDESPGGADAGPDAN